jgi:MarR family transcriptional regulator, lower aerobic nicotinate degradation pathway regulator
MASPDDPPKRLKEMPTWLLNEASMKAHRLLTDALTKAGSRGYHYRLLAALSEYGPASQASLGRRTSVDRSDVVATVDDLVTRGDVIRSRDPADLRRNVITITPNGLRHYRRLDRILQAVQDRLLDPLSPSDRDRLIAMLRRIIDAE